MVSKFANVADLKSYDFLSNCFNIAVYLGICHR